MCEAHIRESRVMESIVIRGTSPSIHWEQEWLFFTRFYNSLMSHDSHICASHIDLIDDSWLTYMCLTYRFHDSWLTYMWLTYRFHDSWLTYMCLTHRYDESWLTYVCLTYRFHDSKLTYRFHDSSWLTNSMRHDSRVSVRHDSHMTHRSKVVLLRCSSSFMTHTFNTHWIFES